MDARGRRSKGRGIMDVARPHDGIGNDVRDPHRRAGPSPFVPKPGLYLSITTSCHSRRCVGLEVREEPMACYRLYFIEGFNGRIDRFIQFEVDSDEAAIDFAKEWQGPLTLDLCNGVRQVKHWDPLGLRH
jgi:hypothetical protein